MSFYHLVDGPLVGHSLAWARPLEIDGLHLVEVTDVGQTGPAVHRYRVERQPDTHRPGVLRHAGDPPAHLPRTAA